MNSAATKSIKQRPNSLQDLNRTSFTASSAHLKQGVNPKLDGIQKKIRRLGKQLSTDYANVPDIHEDEIKIQHPRSHRIKDLGLDRKDARKLNNKTSPRSMRLTAHHKLNKCGLEDNEPEPEEQKDNNQFRNNRFSRGKLAMNISRGFISLFARKAQRPLDVRNVSADAEKKQENSLWPLNKAVNKIHGNTMFNPKNQVKENIDVKHVGKDRNCSLILTTTQNTPRSDLLKASERVLSRSTQWRSKKLFT